MPSTRLQQPGSRVAKPYLALMDTVKDADIRASLGADEIVREEGELTKDWDAIPLDTL